MSYNSAYTGEQIEAKLNIISNSGDGTYYLANDGQYKRLTSADLPDYYTKQEVSDLIREEVTKDIVTFTGSSVQLEANKYYRTTSNLTSLSITLLSPSDTSIVNEYFIEFPCNNTSVSLPSNIKWNNGITPTFENGSTYQISIINDLAIFAEFK